METLHIKNMVCARCVRTVRNELAVLGLEVQNVTLGEAVVEGNVNYSDIRTRLEAQGFELLENNTARWVENVKTAVIQLVRSGTLETLTERVSEYIGRTVGKDYEYLSHLFSSVEAITIERYVILQKIECVKELLMYDELTVSEIAYRLGYSSTAHVSRQFKEVVGMPPSQFKALRHKPRTSLDHVGK
jgi:AraC family transcriptional regulator